MRCDGKMDCMDGSDEACGCQNYCKAGNNFLCADNTCLTTMEGESILCDGVRQCPDGSDERNCFSSKNPALFWNDATTLFALFRFFDLLGQ